MPIQQTKKQTDLEKRLRLLRQQLYGKIEKKSADQKIDTPKPQYSNIPVSSGPSTHTKTITSDISYLYQDLTKIGILASCALALQIILFMLLKNHVLNLNFF